MKRPLILVALLLRVLLLSAHDDKLTEGYWHIAGNHGLAVSNHGAFENETNLYLEKQDITDPAQAWSFIQVGEGEFNIVKPDAYKSIDNNDTGNPNGNAVIQWTTTIGNPNQTWVLEHLGGDRYAIRSRNTGMYLSCIGDGEEGSPVSQIPSDGTQDKTHWTLRKMDVRFDVEEIRTSSSEDWENERIFAVNKEKGRATFTPYPSVEAMQADSSYCRQWFRTVSHDYDDFMHGKEEMTLESFSWEWAEHGAKAVVTAEMTAVVPGYVSGIAGSVPMVMRYTVYSDGAVDVETTFRTDGNSALPRLGLAASIAPGYENVTWYGRGPGENYADREAASWFAVFRNTVGGMRENYARTQTMGNRGEVRWLTLTDDKGRGLKVTAGAEMGFSALHMRDWDLVRMIRHNHDMNRILLPQTILSLDCVQVGLGNGSIDPLDEFLIKKNHVYAFSFRLEGIGISSGQNGRM